MALFLVATQFVAAAAMVALAAWLVWLNPRHPANLAFAGFLAARGVFIVGSQLKDIDQSGYADWPTIQRSATLASMFLLLTFAIAYALPRTRAMKWIAMAGAGGVGVGLIYAAVPCTNFCVTQDGTTWLGPLAMFAFGVPLAMAAVGGILRSFAERETSAARRRATLLLGSALMLNALLDGSLVAARIIYVGPSEFFSPYFPGPWRWTIFEIPLAAALVVLTLVWARRLDRSDTESSWLLRNERWLALSFVVVAAIVAIPALDDLFIAEGVIGVGRTLLPVAAGIAVLQHNLFDIDVRLRQTLKRGTVGLVILAAFFIGAQIAQNYLSQTFGFLVGGIVAGLLLFALQPLQRLGESVAKAFVPNSRPLPQLSPEERVELYRGQASMAWADGVIDRSERRLLDDLRVRLGLPVETAASLEDEAFKGIESVR